MSRFRDLHGRVALVVGGGRVIAENLAARGATTVLAYAHDDEGARRTLAVLDGHGVRAEAIRADATVAADVDTLVEGVVSRHGRLDVVVHATGPVVGKPLADLADTDFDHLVDHNVRSVLHTLRAAALHLADGGRYVLLSTTLAAPAAGLDAASQAAALHLIAAAAKDLEGRRVTVNAVGVRHDDRPAGAVPLVAWLTGADAARVSGQIIHSRTLNQEHRS
ncbi:SDR family oxidoreductase [Nonomuraea longicatena]|uniref:SDR family oxidoreductase n=1 Tax=Nonomuraea longicatena TaxID=83682 RepID=A0ABP3Z9R1_9ACTN